MKAEEIHFHDSTILKVIEVPERGLLAMELDEYGAEWTYRNPNIAAKGTAYS